jgi:hypothetical protein
MLVHINVFIDASHAKNKLTSRSHSGALICSNTAPTISGIQNHGAQSSVFTVHKTGPLLLPVGHPLTLLVTAEHLHCEQTCVLPK